MKNPIDRLLGWMFPDDAKQPARPVFATPLVVQGHPNGGGTGEAWYRVARQHADGSLEGVTEWVQCEADAEHALESLLSEANGDAAGGEALHRMWADRRKP